MSYTHKPLDQADQEWLEEDLSFFFRGGNPNMLRAEMIPVSPNKRPVSAILTEKYYVPYNCDWDYE